MWDDLGVVGVDTGSRGRVGLGRRKLYLSVGEFRVHHDGPRAGTGAAATGDVVTRGNDRGHFTCGGGRGGVSLVGVFLGSRQGGGRVEGGRGLHCRMTNLPAETYST